MSQFKVLLVDDEKNIIELARMYLEREGFSISFCGDGQDALENIRNNHPDLVVLDIMLPGMNGLDICRQLRAEGNNVPVVLLTARDEDVDKIVGLELGADDYLTKPFNPRELVARISAVLRRVHQRNSRGDQVIKLGDLTIDLPRREVTFGSKTILLRYQEFEVLKTLSQNAGLVLTRDQLLNKAWGYDFSGDTRTVDMHIAVLRRKLLGTNIKIETVTGVGYKLVA